MNEHLRQTGRTTRLLEEAARFERTDCRVAVFVHHPQYAQLVRQSRRSYTGPIEVVPEHFDWKAMRDPQRPELKCFVDHAAVELRLQQVDEQIMRLQQLARQLYPLTTN